MRILAIESSADDTSVALIEGNPTVSPLSFTVHAHVTASQTIHQNYGGIFPAKAKGEHVANIIPLIRKAFSAVASPVSLDSQALSHELQILLSHESELISELELLFAQFPNPPIDAIAVTYGPGLEPCLWVGVNTARALAMHFNIPLIPINHMEGHTLSALFEKPSKSGTSVLRSVQYPAMALLISGGHTQLVLMPKPLEYQVVGKTVDDAVGEAYDKVARMMQLPYPGGPTLAALADEYRSLYKTRDSLLKNLFPRPMLHSANFDFSFSGLKTSVLYHIKDLNRMLSHEDTMRLAYAFESAVSEVLAEKTRSALAHYQVNALLLGGGVSNNRHLRRKFTHVCNDSAITLLLPEPEITTDNALMIALAAFYRLSLLPMTECVVLPENLKANGNLKM